MIPERQKWWEALPESEKKARLTIKMYEADIKILKINLTYAVDDNTKRLFNNEIRKDKNKIMELRKYMRMNVIGEVLVNCIFLMCPKCYTGCENFNNNICPTCGQHILPVVKRCYTQHLKWQNSSLEVMK